MDWQDVPMGMISHDELLNALLAIWKTHYNSVNRNSDTFSQEYEAGFEEGLDAVAQVAGITEGFEAGKANHRARVKAKLQEKVEIVDVLPRVLLDTKIKAKIRGICQRR
jgi:hypothetical protein